MTKWEYMIVEAKTHGKGLNTYAGQRARYVNGQELKDYQHGPSLDVFLNSLGENGWEATSMAQPAGGADTLAILLKRPKP